MRVRHKGTSQNFLNPHPDYVIFEEKMYSETKLYHDLNSNLGAPYVSELPGEAWHIC